MKKNISIALLGIFLSLATISIAQLNPNYKQQFSAKIEKPEAMKLYAVTSGSCNVAHNYKQASSPTKPIAVGSKVGLPVCCTNNQSRADYKHTLSNVRNGNCDLGYVCKEDIKLSCCKLTD